ncbi:MAG: hypothetical protein HN764_05815 [Gammaproteobacteria bacterium]|jgi:hypothetical protein|nr:hypothetical protein [Gammaproteobacteria bacterium]
MPGAITEASHFWRMRMSQKPCVVFPAQAGIQSQIPIFTYNNYELAY